MYFIFPNYDDNQQSAATEYLERKTESSASYQPIENNAGQELTGTNPPSVQNTPASEVNPDNKSAPVVKADNTDTVTTAKTVEEDPNATSYYDELTSQDDEVEPGSVSDESDKDTEYLPEEAQSALDILLDAADEAWRINNQFSETVVAGEQLSDILEQSGLDESVSAELINAFPELKNLKAGQQFYWILNKDDQLQYMIKYMIIGEKNTV